MIILAAESIELETRPINTINRDGGAPSLRPMYLRNDQDPRKTNLAEARPKL